MRQKKKEQAEPVIRNTEYSSQEVPYQVIRSRGKVLRSINTYHYHPFVQVDLVLAGEVRYIIEGKEVSVQEGDGIFINANMIHCTIPNGADYISVRFHPMLLSASEYIEKTYITPIISNPAIPYMHLSHEGIQENNILEGIRRFYMFYSAGAEDIPLLAISQLFTIWHTLYAYLPREEAVVQSAHMTTLRKMIGYIQTNYAKQVTLQDIADAGNVSVSGCSALFREIIQDSPYHYLMLYRLEQACMLLISSDDSVTEITEQCGFPDASHFIRLFRLTYGTTPLQYRKHLTKTA